MINCAEIHQEHDIDTYHMHKHSVTSDECSKLAYKYLAILSVLILPRIAIAKGVFKTSSYFATNGAVPYAFSIIAIFISVFITCALAYFVSLLLDKFIFQKYCESLDKMEIYMWFNKIIICVPILIAIVSGTYILCQSIGLENEIASWDGVTANADLKKKFATYYLTLLQKVAVAIVIVLLSILLIYCIVSCLSSSLLEGDLGFSDQIARMKNFMSIIGKIFLAAACLACLAFAILAFSGLLLQGNALLRNILGALAIAALLGCLLLLFPSFLSALLGFLSGLFRSSGSGNNKASKEESI